MIYLFVQTSMIIAITAVMFFFIGWTLRFFHNQYNQNSQHNSNNQHNQNNQNKINSTFATDKQTYQNYNKSYQEKKTFNLSNQTNQYLDADIINIIEKQNSRIDNLENNYNRSHTSNNFVLQNTYLAENQNFKDKIEILNQDLTNIKNNLSNTNNIANNLEKTHNLKLLELEEQMQSFSEYMKQKNQNNDILIFEKLNLLEQQLINLQNDYADYKNSKKETPNVDPYSVSNLYSTSTSNSNSNSNSNLISEDNYNERLVTIIEPFQQELSMFKHRLHEIDENLPSLLKFYLLKDEFTPYVQNTNEMITVIKSILNRVTHIECYFKKLKLTAPEKPNFSDDLCKIVGIGSWIKKKLSEQGITSLEQLAKLTKDQIDKISTDVYFNGRIIRDRWIEQANKLIQEKNIALMEYEINYKDYTEMNNVLNSIKSA